MSVENSSELVVAEIVDLLPQKYQTEGNRDWVRGELATRTPNEMIALCQEHFTVSNGKIKRFEKRIEQMGLVLDAHIKYTDQQFSKVQEDISGIKNQASIDRVHLEYTKKELDRVAQEAKEAKAEAHRANTQALVANAKAEGASERAGDANRKSFSFGGDPLIYAISFFVISSIGCYFLASQQPRVQSQPASTTFPTYECGGSVLRQNQVVDFSKCKRVD